MNTTMTKNKTRTQGIASVNTGTAAVTKGGMAVLAGSSALVGIWATACMAIALVSSGPAELIRGWLGAVIG